MSELVEITVTDVIEIAGLVEQLVITQPSAIEIVDVGTQGPQGPVGPAGPASTVPGPTGPAGPVSSVGLSAPTGLAVSGSPVTGAGTLALSYAAGYSIPSDATQANWNTAYGWGNHASAGYLVPALSNVAVSGLKTATFNGQGASTTTSGAVTIDWTTAQNYLQTEPTGAITYTFTAPPGPCHLQLIINSDGTSTAQTITWPASVIQYNSTWAGANNKKSIINFWYDGTSYHMMAGNQV